MKSEAAISTPVDLIEYGRVFSEDAWKELARKAKGLSESQVIAEWEAAIKAGREVLPLRSVRGWISMPYSRHGGIGRWYAHGTSPQGLASWERTAIRCPGMIFLSVDVSASHLRILARESRDQALIAACAREGDLWAQLAGDLGVDRATAKRSFLVLLNGGKKGVDPKVLDGFPGRYPEAWKWLQWVRTQSEYRIRGFEADGIISFPATAPQRARQALVFQTVEGNLASRLIERWSEWEDGVRLVTVMHDGFGFLVDPSAIPIKEARARIYREMIGYLDGEGGDGLFRVKGCLHSETGPSWGDLQPGLRGQPWTPTATEAAILQATPLAQAYLAATDAPKWKMVVGTSKKHGHVTTLAKALIEKFRATKNARAVRDGVQKVDAVSWVDHAWIQGEVLGPDPVFLRGTLAAYDEQQEAWRPMDESAYAKKYQEWTTTEYLLDDEPARQPFILSTVMATLKTAALLRSVAEDALLTHGIPFRDGTLQPDGHLAPRTRADLVKTDELFPWAWVDLATAEDRDAKVQEVRSYIRSLLDPNLPPADQEALVDWILWLLGRAAMRRPAKKILLLLDGTEDNVGDNGKTTFINLLSSVLPKTSQVPPSRVGTFEESNLIGSYLNSVPDLVFADLERYGELLKSVSGADRRECAIKYKDAYSYTPTALWVIGSNRLPHAAAKDSAFYKRYSIIRFPRVFPPSETFPRYLETLRPWLVVAAAEVVIAHPEMVEPAVSRTAVRDWTDGSSPVKAWGDERLIIGQGRTTLSALFLDFQIWAKQNNQKGASNMNSRSFARDMKRVLGVEVVNAGSKKQAEYPCSLDIGRYEESLPPVEDLIAEMENVVRLPTPTTAPQVPPEALAMLEELEAAVHAHPGIVARIRESREALVHGAHRAAVEALGRCPLTWGGRIEDGGKPAWEALEGMLGRAGATG